MFSCYYGFELVALCKASYELNDGTLVGAGLVDFTTTNFEIAITGGTGRYGGARGDLRSAAADRHAQRIVFALV